MESHNDLPPPAPSAYAIWVYENIVNINNMYTNITDIYLYETLDDTSSTDSSILSVETQLNNS